MALSIHKQSSLSSVFLYTLLVFLHRSLTVSAVPIGSLDTTTVFAKRGPDGESDASDGNENERKNIIQLVVIMLVVAAVLGSLLAGWSGIKWIMRRRADKIQHQADFTNSTETSRMTPLETIDLTPPSPSHIKSSRSSRCSDTWERYLNMIQTPARLNQAVKAMKSQNPGRWNKIKDDMEESKDGSF
ncbi:1068_t:CDS:2 [Paraglomus occultum]|uniref:1068_t:CDS:1 n=1 Tax=Paraglomus occultum TaxID=144539 RepID=A0A9N9G8M4_9GLOM|nr:1068_t:CDS:2 [Paraglomus occultum]